jgi:uncharacterized protein (DUF362 family)/Pyruvate/2-oxoacid:ferredoxin oxidoreductase delta subunit
MYKVLIDRSTYADVSSSIERVFQTFPIQLTNKKVLIKPNVLRSSNPEEHICTNQAVVRAIVEFVERMSPASIVVGDNPGIFSYGANEASFRQTGLMDAAKGYYVNIGLDSVPVTFNPDYAEHVSISRAVLEADVVISVPKFKTHGLTVITGAIKNSYGILPGAQKAMLHKAAGNPERFQHMVVDVFKLRVPHLFIMDAIVGMEGNGPASPDLRAIGVILASDNAVALDSVVARMMGVDPSKLTFLTKAEELGIGSYNIDDLQVIGQIELIPDFKVPPLGGEAIMNNEGLQAAISNKTLLRPKADVNLCTGCGTCIEQCSVKALQMVDDIPQVDADTCITCFCCQEVCPEKAITLQ